MSIATRTGDQGLTGLMYNRRVPKHHPRVEAYGCVDELNAALGCVRATSSSSELQARILEIQRDLVILMGELATDPADLPRYAADGFQVVTASRTARLDALLKELEPALGKLTGWVMPGENPLAAAMDLARTVCRRAERRASALLEARQLENPEILVYLNRLADILWLMARHAERAA